MRIRFDSAEVCAPRPPGRPIRRLPADAAGCGFVGRCGLSNAQRLAHRFCGDRPAFLSLWLRPADLPRLRLARSGSAQQSPAQTEETESAPSRLTGLSRRQLKISTRGRAASSNPAEPARSAHAPAGLCATSRIHSMLFSPTFLCAIFRDPFQPSRPARAGEFRSRLRRA